MRAVDILGMKFGRLSVIERSGVKSGYVTWKCACDCGSIVVIDGKSLRAKRSTSCGCRSREHARAMGLKNATHKRTKTKEYRAWNGMHGRCENPRVPIYPRYGGRGISVCERWKSFENFLADMGMAPSKSYQIDRIDNDGNYEPSNCRWATASQQARNRRTNKLFFIDGEMLCACEIAERFAMRVDRLYARLNHGWTIERAVHTPIRRYGC